MVRNAFTGGELVSKVATKALLDVSADGVLARKWSGPHVVRDGLSPSVDPGISFLDDPGVVDPSHKDDSDVNRIVERFHRTGVLPGVDVQSIYSDFADAPTYHDAMNIVAHANEQFASLDANVRKRFQNDPAEFLAFCSDKSNLDEMKKLGLVVPTPSKEPLTPRDSAPIESDKVSKKGAAVPKEPKRNPPGGSEEE